MSCGFFLSGTVTPSIPMHQTDRTNSNYTMNIKREIVIEKPVSEVWMIVGSHFGDAYKWARGLNHSEGHGESEFEGATCRNRTCQVPGFGKIKEVIQEFDQVNHVLSYEVVEGFPGFISSAVNTWNLEAIGQKKTKVTMNLVMNTTGIKGAIMGPMMKMNLNKMISGVVSDLKIYAETGKPSPYKTKELEETEPKAA